MSYKYYVTFGTHLCPKKFFHAMPNPDNTCIRLHKKICNPTVVAIIQELAIKWHVTSQEAAYRLLNEAVLREEKKRKEFEALMKQNAS